MSSRLKAEIFVTALLRTQNAQGRFATVLRKGQGDAGAIFVVVRAREGRLRLFVPAGQYDYHEDASERLFTERQIEDEAALKAFVEKEERFDPDFWLIEIEDDGLEAPVTLIAPEKPSTDFPF